MSGDKKESVSTRLMKLMGSKTGEWDPMPPAQYLSYLGVSHSEDLRVWAAILERTIGRGDDGNRSAHAREAKGADTKPKHLVAALDMLPSQVSEALGRLDAAGYISRKAGRIWLRADVPAPVMVPKKRKGEETENFHYTVNVSSDEALYLKKLAESDAEGFHAVSLRLVAAHAWDAKLQADAIAWAREHGTDARNRVLTEAGYTKRHARGNKRIRPASTSDTLKLPESFEQFTVQVWLEISKRVSRFTVQGGKLIPYTEPKIGVQNPHPYGPEIESSESQLATAQGRSNPAHAASEAELRREALRAEIKNELNARLRAAGLKTMGALTLDAATIDNIVRPLLPLDTAKAVREVLDVIEDRAREIRSGKRTVDGWGYLVNIAKSEAKKRLPAGVKESFDEQIKAAAAGRKMP